ncbi:hypothetical protein D1007_54730 [Hordeum vulgare]|nr:hypothetical protein D1007_54730 [Hordeum vulgare]
MVENTKENYNGSGPGTSEASKIAMAFMAGLAVGKNWVHPLISKKRSSSMEESSLIISRRSADSLGSAHATGLGQVLSDSSMSSHGRGGLDPMLLLLPPVICGEETSSGPAVGSNLCLVKTIVLYDDRGGTLIYESKEGEKDRFIKRRSIWLSEHTGRIPYAFMDSLVLRGPRRPMTAYDGCWIIQTDVPVESSFRPQDPEMPGRVSETTLFVG